MALVKSKSGTLWYIGLRIRPARINNKNDSTGQTLATTNEDKVDNLNNYFASVFINETYEEVEEEANSGIPNMDKIVIEEDVILKKTSQY